MQTDFKNRSAWQHSMVLMLWLSVQLNTDATLLQKDRHICHLSWLWGFELPAWSHFCKLLASETEFHVPELSRGAPKNRTLVATIKPYRKHIENSPKPPAACATILDRGPYGTGLLLLPERAWMRNTKPFSGSQNKWAETRLWNSFPWVPPHRGMGRNSLTLINYKGLRKHAECPNAVSMKFLPTQMKPRTT